MGRRLVTRHAMYKPSQRQVQVDMLAAPGWVSGRIHVPERSALLPFLNKKSEYLPMTGLPGGEPGGFLAMRRQAIILMLPDPRDINSHGCIQPGTFEPCVVRCMLPAMTVEGTIQVLSGQRMSDFLETSPGFFLLSDCTLTSDDGHVQEGVPHVIVHAQHLLAVADLTGREHGHVVSLLEFASAGR